MDAGGLLGTILKIAFILIIILTFAPVLIWAERRQSAMIQDRIGPTRADIKIFGKSITLLGLLHPLADALKFVWKEDFVPPRADKLMHSLAPIIALVPSIAVFAVIPFGGQLFLDHLWDVLPQGSVFSGDPVTLQVANINVGILYVFAIAGTGVVGAAIAGYSSDSKYALLGGVRAAGQMVSYEVTLGLALVGCFMVYDTLLIGDMIAYQRKVVEWLPGNFSLWGIVYQPLAFFLYFTAAIAESKRIPFDIPEGESELAAGYFTEYSGMKFGMFFMGEFVEVISSSGLLIALFLGGYDLPFLEDYGFDFFGLVIGVPHVAVIALQVVTFIIKLVIIIWLQLMIRWSLPRFRYDQLMQLCWKLLLPLSLLNILVTGAVILFLESLGG
ncbi:MAG: NADH-ubiquinone oxidoreductase chain [Myxococcaceae bacterium]|nr:NADH-ubiquinone oxidoreductase chain [Myxococcaceae bacterium]